MKKIIGLSIVVFASIFLLCACTGKPNKSNESDKGEIEMGTKKPIPDSQVWLHTLHPWLHQEKEQIDDYFDFLTDKSNWEYVAANADAIEFFGYIMASSDGWTDERVVRFCDMIKATGLRISLELAGGPDRYMYRRFIEQGVYFDYGNFDGVIWRLMHPDGNADGDPAMTREEAAGEFVHIIKEWREVFPDMKFNYLWNFPNHGWKGDASITYPGTPGYSDAYLDLIAVEKAAREAGIPLHGVVLDAPYDYNRNGKSLNGSSVKGDLIDRLLDAEREIKALGLKYHLIFNCETPGAMGPDGQYYKDTLLYIDEYEKRGGKPDVYIIESWYDVSPSKHIPEDAPYTLTYLTAEVLRHVKEGKPIDVSDLDFGWKPPENLTSVKKWSFADGKNGWAKANDISNFTVENGILTLESIGGDPYFVSKEDLKINAMDCDYMVLRLRNLTDCTGGEVFFSREDSRGMAAEMSCAYWMEAGEGWQDVYVDLKQNDLWDGEIWQLRIDPASGAGTFEFEYIELLKQN